MILLNLLYLVIAIFIFQALLIAIQNHSSRLSNLTILLVFFHFLVALGFFATFPINAAPLEGWFLSQKIKNIAITFLPLIWVIFIRTYTKKETNTVAAMLATVVFASIAIGFLFKDYHDFVSDVSAKLSAETFFDLVMTTSLKTIIILIILMSVQTYSLIVYIKYTKENKVIPKFEILTITLIIYLMIISQLFIVRQIQYKIDFTTIVTFISTFLIYRVIVDNETKNTIPVSNSKILDKLPNPILILNTREEIIYANKKAFDEIPNLTLGEKFQNLKCIITNDNTNDLLNTNSITIDNKTLNTQYTYLVKQEPFENDYFILKLVDATGDKAKIANLQKQSMTDSLTGLLNKSTFNDLAKQEISNKEKGKKTLALVMFDLDHFKKINDTFGHPVGDDVLVAFASDLNFHIRQNKISGRFGGEEFCALISEDNKYEIVKSLENFREKFSKRNFVVDGTTFNVTVSAGVIFIDDRFTTLERLFEIADKALYESKNNGRNKVTYYDITNCKEL